MNTSHLKMSRVIKIGISHPVGLNQPAQINILARGLKFLNGKLERFFCLGKGGENESRCEKTNVLVSDQVCLNPGCTVTEDSWRHEISDLRSRGIVLSM